MNEKNMEPFHMSFFLLRLMPRYLLLCNSFDVIFVGYI